MLSLGKLSPNEKRSQHETGNEPQGHHDEYPEWPISRHHCSPGAGGAAQCPGQISLAGGPVA